MLDQTTRMLRGQLKDRIRPDSSYTPDLRQSVDSAFDLLDRFEIKRDGVLRDVNFSDTGKRSALADAVRDDFAPALARGAARKARWAAQHAASRKAAIGKPAFDKSDLAGGLERREIRDFVRGKPPGERVQVAFELVKDRKLGEALLSGPSVMLTGLSPQDLERVHRTFLATHFAEEFAEIEAHSLDIEAVSAAVKIVWTKLAGASNMSDVEFDRFWQGLEQEADK